MKTLTKELGAVLGAAFGDEGFDPHYGAVRLSDRPELAQFQCNGAMQAAKKAGENPRGLAERIVERIKGNNIFSQTEIAGPGFINLSITDTALGGYLAQGAADERLGAPQFADGETMILDYGGPNAAKAMHVGHLRPTVIGDCLKRIMRHAGYKALGDVHMGDWGLQFGQIISEVERLHPDWAYFQNAESGPFPEEPPFTFPELEEIYPAAAAACKEDPARLEEARRTTAELQRGKPGYMAVWRDVMKLSMDHMKANFDALDVHFEIWKGEADVEGLIPEVEQDLRQKGLAEESEGAVIVPVAEESDRKTIPPLIYKKSDGAATYGTTDVATIYDRVQNYPDLKALVYVVISARNCISSRCSVPHARRATQTAFLSISSASVPSTGRTASPSSPGRAGSCGWMSCWHSCAIRLKHAWWRPNWPRISRKRNGARLRTMWRLPQSNSRISPTSRMSIISSTLTG